MLKALEILQERNLVVTCLTMDFAYTVAKQLYITSHENRNNLQRTLQGNVQSFDIKTKNQSRPVHYTNSQLNAKKESNSLVQSLIPQKRRHKILSNLPKSRAVIEIDLTQDLHLPRQSWSVSPLCHSKHL